MRRLTFLALVSMACAHAHEARETAQAPDAGGSTHRQRAARRSPAGPKLPVVPEGMMVKDGPAQIQKALAGRGYLQTQSGKLDDATSAALRKFQGDQQLAKTGVPDRTTLRKLGLNPDKILSP